MKKYYSHSESICGRSCSISENVSCKEITKSNCASIKKYNAYHLVVPNRIIKREKDRSQRSEDLYNWQKSNACKCHCSKSMTRLGDKSDDLTIGNVNWKCKQFDRNYIRKSLVNGLKDLGIRCLEDQNPKAEVFFLSSPHEKPVLTNSNLYPEAIHPCEIKKKQPNIVRPVVRYNCRNKQLHNIELELRYQAFKECIVGKMDKKFWKKNRPIDSQHVYKTLVKCGNLALEKRIEETALTSKHNEVYNAAEKQQVNIDGNLGDIENYEKTSSKLNKKTQKPNQSKTNDLNTQIVTQFSNVNDDETEANENIISSKFIADETQEMSHLPINEGNKDFTVVDKLENQDINNLELQNGEYNQDFNEMDPVGNTILNGVASSYQEKLVLEGIPENSEAVINDEAYEYEEANNETTLSNEIAKDFNNDKLIEDTIISDVPVVQESIKTPLKPNMKADSQEKNDQQSNQERSESSNTLISEDENGVKIKKSKNKIDEVRKENQELLGIDVNNKNDVDEFGNPISRNKNYQKEKKSLDSSNNDLVSSEESFDSPYIDPSKVNEIIDKICNLIVSRLSLQENALNKLLNNIINKENGECDFSGLRNTNVDDLMSEIDYINAISSSSLVMDENSKLRSENVKNKSENEILNLNHQQKINGINSTENQVQNATKDINKVDFVKKDILFENGSTIKGSNETDKMLPSNINEMPSDFKTYHRNELENQNVPIDEKLLKGENRMSSLISKDKINLKTGGNVENIYGESNYQEIRVSGATDGLETLKQNNKIDGKTSAKSFKDNSDNIHYSNQPYLIEQSNDDAHNKELNSPGKNKVNIINESVHQRRLKIAPLTSNKTSRRQTNSTVYKTQNFGVFPKPDFIYGDSDKLKSNRTNRKLNNQLISLKNITKDNNQLQRNCFLTYTLLPKKLPNKSDFKLPIKTYCKLVTESNKCQPIKSCFIRSDVNICKRFYKPTTNNRNRISNCNPIFNSKKIYDIPKLYGMTCLMKPKDYCMKSIKLRGCSKVS